MTHLDALLNTLLNAPVALGRALGRVGSALLGEAAATPPREPDFQPYIFWAYGAVCALLFFFTLWTLLEARKVSKRVDYLADRLRRAHPDLPTDDPA